METKHIIGKRIASVEQSRFYDSERRQWFMSVASITLADGTKIIPSAIETFDRPIVDCSVSKPSRSK